MAAHLHVRTKVFISYSHQDAKWLHRLCIHLRPLEREQKIEIWADTKINPGTKWREEIREALATAKVAVLLVTPEFLASDFIATDELPPLLSAAEKEGVVILPVIVSHSMFESIPSLARFQAANDPAKPLTAMRRDERDAALVRLCKAIQDAIRPPPEPVQNPVAPPYRVTAPPGGKKREYAPLPETMRRPLEILVRYELNRDVQESAFVDAVLMKHMTGARGPLVCVVHGDRDALPFQFITRLFDRALPRTLKGLAPESAAHPRTERLPISAFSLENLTEQNYETEMWGHLRVALGCTRSEEVRSVLVSKKAAVMIDVSLFTGDWDGGDLQKLNLFLEFWNGRHWQDLPHDFFLIVCLYCTYRPRPEQKASKADDPNQDMRRYIAALEPDRYKNFHLVPIKELHAIRQGEVHALIAHLEVTAEFDFDLDGVNKLFEDSEICTAGGIHIQVLIERLPLLDRRRWSGPRARSRA